MPVPTIACISGHAYAGGFFTALACDYLVMRSNAVALMTEVRTLFHTKEDSRFAADSSSSFYSFLTAFQ